MWQPSTLLANVALLASGWLLSWVARQFQIRRERRAAIGRALSNLLELHHQLTGMETTIAVLHKELSMPDAIAAPLRHVLERLGPSNDHLAKRYEAAIEQLAEYDPITAYELRAKCGSIQFLSSWRDLALKGGIPPSDIEAAERQIRDWLLPQIKSAISRLARLHGVRTALKARKLLSKRPELPAELQSFLVRWQKQAAPKSTI